MKRQIDIEKLVAWAYFELDKGGSSVWSPWVLITRFGRWGTWVDDQFGAAFKLPAWFGDTHPDARIIGHAVEKLGHPARALVEMHGRANSRPKVIPWKIRISPIYKGTQPLVIGSSYGKSARGRWRYYREGAYCPLIFKPTVAQIEASRAEYRSWHDGLIRLVRALNGHLGDHVPTGPIAPAEPWNEPPSTARILYRIG